MTSSFQAVEFASLLHLRVACFPIAGAAEPGELWEYLHRTGSAELPANCAAVTSHPQ